MLNPPALHIPRKQQERALFARIRGAQELVAIEDVKDDRDVTHIHGEVFTAVAVKILVFGLREIGREIGNHANDAK